MSAHPSDLSSLYRELILSNAADPCGQDKAIAATHQAVGNNPLCGDEVTVRLHIENGLIQDAAFSGESCAICTASVSLLCRHLPGQAVAAVVDSWAGFKAALEHADLGTLNTQAAPATGGVAVECPDFMRPMLGVAQYPARIACAKLPWATARRALQT